MARLRKGCSHSKNESKCKYYSLTLSSCIQYRDKDDCELLKRSYVDHRKSIIREGEKLFRQ